MNRGGEGVAQRESSRMRLLRLDGDSAETALFREAVLEHDLPAEQLRFTDLPVRTLPDADGDPHRFPYAVVMGEGRPTELDRARAVCAGFGILDRSLRGSLVDAPERAVLLRAFYVTPRWQGRGVGRASCSSPLLDRLAVEVAPHAERIVLCVGQSNLPAQRVYCAAGFGFTGHVIPGKTGPEDVMSRPLDTQEHPEPRTRHRRTENSQ